MSGGVRIGVNRVSILVYILAMRDPRNVHYGHAAFYIHMDVDSLPNSDPWDDPLHLNRWQIADLPTNRSSHYDSISGHFSLSSERSSDSTSAKVKRGSWLRATDTTPSSRSSTNIDNAVLITSSGFLYAPERIAKSTTCCCSDFKSIVIAVSKLGMFAATNAPIIACNHLG